ncbi:hypothetical protein Tsubulata_036728 [Turnera subulata]|uniref:UBC core domain-containing protein n=1 Tax=Turnera subulata TaxID=218843 RepID=A0A9Q0JCY2_9ROSI|nr:hypothetical protein Tsubulata_036728 [Turnera subulata]
MDVFSGDSDWESSSDSGSSEDIEELDFLYGGEAHSIVSSLTETIGKIDDLLSFERGFIHGDIVCSVTDPSGQMGRVTSVNMFVDLESIHGKIIKNVDSKKLLRIRSLLLGDYVVYGPWIGRVEKIVDAVTIIFDDGTSSEVTGQDLEKLVPISRNLIEDSAFPYYPGQRVQIRHSTVSKSTKWLCAAWKECQDLGTVSAVKPGLVYVDWLASAVLGHDSSFPTPCRVQDAKNLTPLSCFPHENWQLGDWCILSTADSEGGKEQNFFQLLKEHRKMGNGFKRQDQCPNFQAIFLIVKTKTVVDVVWQDGECSRGLDSQCLLPVNIVNAHDFLPGQFVLEKGTCDDPHVSGNQKWGVVDYVDAKERTVRVKWKSKGAQENVEVSDQMEETVSAYELVEHPDFSYCYGDVVFRHLDQHDHLNGQTGNNEDAALKGNGCAQEEIDCTSRSYLLYIGCVTGFKDGAVEVTWASGSKTKVAPTDIFRIDKYEGSATPHSEEQSIEVNEDIVDPNEQFSVVKGKDFLNSDGNTEECKKYSWESSAFSFPRNTVAFFTSIAASIFGSYCSTSASGPNSSDEISNDQNECIAPEEKEILEACDICMEMRPLIVAGMERLEHKTVNEEVSNIRESKELPSFSGSENLKHYRQFDMVNDCSDHHFLDVTGKGVALSQVNKSWLKKVQQDWSILEKDLPDSIYVRIYEERMDLIRAAIVGASGTPYNDGLFFFDIYLPPEYPYKPPLVHYRSGGLRVNPNLYESGKALVLNEKPYFNEAGYDKQVGRAEGEKNSVSYNENAFLMTWKSMLYLLRQPPKHFEELLEEHLKRRSLSILSACEAYMKGAPVALGCGKPEHDDQKGSSTGFKIMLAKLFPKLVEAFSEKGIDCSPFNAPKE